MPAVKELPVQQLQDLLQADMQLTSLSRLIGTEYRL
jgi:hypothetical protein